MLGLVPLLVVVLGVSFAFAQDESDLISLKAWQSTQKDLTAFTYPEAEFLADRPNTAIGNESIILFLTAVYAHLLFLSAPPPISPLSNFLRGKKILSPVSSCLLT
jgi:hypothetical protein